MTTDGENTEADNQPSTSKNENQRAESTQELYNDRRKYDEKRDDRGSNSESFTSGSYSARSKVDIVEARPEVAKPMLAKREAKGPEKKKRARRPGRVDKRRTRRQDIRRPSKRKPRMLRDVSVSTIFTRLSSQSGSRHSGCKFCGHRCCRRRFKYELRRAEIRFRKKKIRRNNRKILPKLGGIRTNKGTKEVQAGSRCHMLSPLFVKTNAVPNELPEMPCLHCERHYPVSRNEDDLQMELTEKLRIAAIVGIVTSVGDDHWCLNSALQKNRSLSKSHVTKFWQIYTDTMSPVRRRENPRNVSIKSF
ncbi:unnamed protein product [Diatraea saccharalis]|uniref:Uncharacterized protein n=1 Tax=Diatraea saccharalis TaxID=40085 RepID=A0A9N9RGR8_9NEOP|nr:unnamed protein product [Diatraea saccharalis]